MKISRYPTSNSSCVVRREPPGCGEMFHEHATTHCVRWNRGPVRSVRRYAAGVRRGHAVACAWMREVSRRSTRWPSPPGEDRLHQVHPPPMPMTCRQMAGLLQEMADMTREHLDPVLLDLVPSLKELMPPARDVLTKEGIQTVVLTGGETDVCVLAAASARSISIPGCRSPRRHLQQRDDTHDASLETSGRPIFSVARSRHHRSVHGRGPR